MLKKSKRTAFIVGAVFLILTLIVFVIMRATKPKEETQNVTTFVKFSSGAASKNQTAKTKKIDTTDPQAVDAELGLSTSKSTTESSGTKGTSLTNSELVHQAMQDYLTVTLDSGALESRNGKLAQVLAPDLYTSLNIEVNTATLKTMWENWQKDKVLDTNQPVQLINQAVSNLTVFQDTTNETNFIVKAALEIQSPASPNTSHMDQEYTVQVQDGAIVALTKVSEEAQKNE